MADPNRFDRDRVASTGEAFIASCNRLDLSSREVFAVGIGVAIEALAFGMPPDKWADAVEKLAAQMLKGAQVRRDAYLADAKAAGHG